jgi:uncharacterized protein (TIGR03435 family)
MASIVRFQVNLINCVLCLAIVSVMIPSPALARSSHPGSSADNAPAEKQFEFEVVSIRPHKPGTNFLPRQFTPDGYRTSMSLRDMIMTAYNPQHGNYWSSSKVHNLPDWADGTYDINARIAQEDIAAWQQAQLDSQFFKDPGLERSALRAILKDRFKLALHMTPIEVPCLNLIVDKHGAKLKDTVPGAIKPVKLKTMKLGEGFFIEDAGERQFVGVTIKELASLMTRLSRDYPVQDETGLTGRYDFTLPWYDYRHYPDSEFSNPLDRMPTTGIGIVLKRGKAPAFIFDIDHIEKPDAN